MLHRTCSVLPSTSRFSGTVYLLHVEPRPGPGHTANATEANNREMRPHLFYSCQHPENSEGKAGDLPSRPPGACVRVLLDLFNIHTHLSLKPGHVHLINQTLPSSQPDPPLPILIMAQPASNAPNLTVEQGIGIGIAVGFVAALALVTTLLALTRITRFASLPIVSNLKKLITPPQTVTQPAIPSVTPSVTLAVTSDDNVLQRVGNDAIVWRSFPNAQGVLKWKPNPASKHVKCLVSHMFPVHGKEAIKSATPFHHFIRQLVWGVLEDVDHPDRMPQISESAFDESQLVRLAGEPVNGGTWSKSISTRKTRGAALQCFLAQLIFRRIDPLGSVEETLLPPEIAAMYQLLHRIVGPRKDDPTRFQRMSRSDATSTECNANQPIGYDTLAVWRETVWLLTQDYYDLNFPCPGFFHQKDDPRKEKTDALALEVEEALKLETLRCIGKTDDGLRRELQIVFEGATNSAMVLFCQPCTWEYEWVSNEPGFMVFPAVRLVWDEDDTKFFDPAEVVNLDAFDLQ